jgi:NitT/TauT family transport system substrate-binding protein
MITAFAARLATAFAVFLGTLVTTAAASAESLTLAVSHAVAWDTSIPSVAERKNLFKDHGLDVEILYTSGTSETVQAVLSGSADVGVAVGFLGLFSAYTKGAPIRVIAPQWTGASDMFWYVRADSTIKSLADANGRSMAFSRPGSSTNLVALALASQHGVTPNLVPTGDNSATLTQVMSGQIDIGYALAPSALQEVREGKLRVVASGSDATAISSQTTRVIIARADVVESKPTAIERFLKAYGAAIDAAYADPAVIDAFAQKLKLDLDLVRDALTHHHPKAAMQTSEIRGLGQTMEDAVKYGYIAAPLTPEQIRELIPLAYVGD